MTVYYELDWDVINVGTRWEYKLASVKILMKTWPVSSTNWCFQSLFLTGKPVKTCPVPPTNCRCYELKNLSTKTSENLAGVKILMETRPVSSTNWCFQSSPAKEAGPPAGKTFALKQNQRILIRRRILKFKFSLKQICGFPNIFFSSQNVTCMQHQNHAKILLKRPPPRRWNLLSTKTQEF